MQLIVGIYKAALYRQFTRQWHLYLGERYITFNLPFRIQGEGWFRYSNGSRWHSPWRRWRDEELDGW